MKKEEPKYYIKIRRISDGKYLYKIKEENVAFKQKHKHFITTGTPFKPTLLPCFTNDINKAEVIDDRNKAEEAIDICTKHFKNSVNDYLIIEYTLVEKTMDKFFLNIERGSYLFKIRSREFNEFVDQTQCHPYSSVDITYSKRMGKFFKQYSVAKNFFKYQIFDVFNGYEQRVSYRQQEKLKTIFEIVPFSLEKIHKRFLLTEKV